jgi:hypothetical protein
MVTSSTRNTAAVHRASDAQREEIARFYAELVKREMFGFALCNLVICAVGSNWIQYGILAALFLPGSIAAVGGRWILISIGKQQSSAIGQLLSFVSTTFTVLSLIYVAFVAGDEILGPAPYLLQSARLN